MIDAVPMGEPPGTVALIEPDRPGDVAGAGPAMDAHSMNPAVVLQMLAAMGGQVGRVVVVGCQPSVIDERMGLSPPVEAAVERGVAAVHEVLAELCIPNEESRVIRRLILASLLILLAALVVRNLPDVARYLKMRRCSRRGGSLSDRARAVSGLDRGSIHPAPHPDRDIGTGGWVELELGKGGRLGAAAAPARLGFRVDRLTSGSPFEDRELRRRIDARRFPTITGDMTSIEPTGEDGRYRVAGDLTFRRSPARTRTR